VNFYIEGKLYKIDLPPSTVEVSENFFADETEVTNIDYNEFLYWLERLHGKNSIEYTFALPDTLVWMNEINSGEPITTNRFRHPVFNDSPIVGITLDQAKAFTNWRTERVVELYLLEKGFITYPNNYDLNESFTIERYLEGGHKWIIEKKQFWFLDSEYQILRNGKKLQTLKVNLNMELIANHDLIRK